MAPSEPVTEAPQEVIRVPRVLFERRPGDGDPGQDALHVHVHLPGKAARSGRAFLGIAGGGVALVAAFLAGVISAGSPNSVPSAAELAALQRLAGLPALAPPPEGAPASGMPLLPPGGGASLLPPTGGAPSMPAGLQQMLSQPPRVQLPPGAASVSPTRTPAVQGAPATAPVVEGARTRNAFGLEN
ncbi:hypothetical protein GXW71_09875 [Roseomonas hellenica]|uniref:Uncharacterized protein n=1 Tax=Plastoroseomonas hellenica TaxID=2687306 RepID=A0ABS5EWJ0_9PROT|nr:hypothetical protein [Plastoroseomonas hellenica]MBR0664659.1 hypothetical protein [Plastoroseomonas hellenica]